ncbi:MAG TPA: hypothetical protein VF651_07595 [Gammaproteobacteria bacterium]
MKSMRIPLITLALAGAMTAAWGAESVMNLISSGEAVQKEVVDNKAKMDAAQQKNKDLAGQGKAIQSDKAKILADLDAWNKQNDSVKQRVADYQTKCGPDKKLNQDEFKACTAEKDQLNVDIAKVNSDVAEINKRNESLNARIPAYNDAIQKSPEEIKAAFADYNASLKKEAAWLDQARGQMSSDAFKSYGKKAGCPDVSKPAKTAEVMIKMTDDVIACLKKVSNS